MGGAASIQALSRLPADAPGDTKLGLEQVAEFLGDAFDRERFEELATTAEDGSLHVTLVQLTDFLKTLAADEGGVAEEKGGDGFLNVDEFHNEDEEEESKSARGSSSSRGGSRSGSRPTTRDEKRDKLARRKARNRELEEIKKPAEAQQLTPKARMLSDEYEAKCQTLRLMQRVRFIRNLVAENIKKRKEEEEARKQALEDEIEANKEEAKANAAIAKLSEERKKAGWGNWHTIKKNEDDEDEEEAPEEEEVVVVVTESEAEIEAKQAEAERIEKEGEDMQRLEEEIKGLREKIDDEMRGEERYVSPAFLVVGSFLSEHYKHLSPASRTPEQVAPSYAPNACFSLDPGKDSIRGRGQCVDLQLRAFLGLTMKFSVVKVDIARKPASGCLYSLSAIVSVVVDEDAPRLVMEVFDLVQCTDAGLEQCLCISRHSVVVRDNRPLYTFAAGNPPKTRHDNLEPHIRANFPPTAEELAEIAAEALLRDRRDFAWNDTESRLFEEEWVLQKAKRDKQAAEAAEKERLAKLFAEEEDDEEDEGEEGEEEEEEPDDGKPQEEEDEDRDIGD